MSFIRAKLALKDKFRYYIEHVYLAKCVLPSKAGLSVTCTCEDECHNYMGQICIIVYIHTFMTVLPTIVYSRSRCRSKNHYNFLHTCPISKFQRLADS